jgi:hypothetical protein
MANRKKIPAEIDRRVRIAARNRCGYCLSPQHLVMSILEIDHLTPLAHGGTDDEENLWLACSFCNGHKSDKLIGIDPETGQQTVLFNPRTQVWREHFHWSDDGLLVVGITPTGRVTIIALHLNDDSAALMVRRNWVSVGWHPPKDAL